MSRKFQPRQKYTQGAWGVIYILPVLFFHKNNQYSLGVIMRVILTSKFYFLKSTAIQCTPRHSPTGPVGLPLASRLGGQGFASRGCAHIYNGTQ
jgi:hypothetical protein